MSKRTLVLTIAVMIAPFLQGCLTQAMWKKHYSRQAIDSCDVSVDAVYVSTASVETEEATLYLCYSLEQKMAEEEPFNSHLPIPGGCIALRASESQIREVSEALTRTARTDRQIVGTLVSDPTRPEPLDRLAFYISPESTEDMTKKVPLGTNDQWSIMDAPDANVTPLPLAEPVPLRVVCHRTESNTTELVLLTPVTLTLDIALDAVIGCFYILAGYNELRHVAPCR